MPLDRLDAETRFKAIEELAGQCDFRQHDERLPACFERFGDGLEIDFGFAGARHAVEKRDRVIAGFDGAHECCNRAGLIVGEFGDAMARVRARKRALGNRHLNETAGQHEAIDDAR